MVKVTVQFQNGTSDTFYANRSYSSFAEGRMLYWESDERGEVISYPTSDIKKIVEQDVES